MHATDFVRSYFDAWNQADAKGVAGHLAEDGVYCDIPINKQFSGDDLVADLSEFFTADHHSYQLVGEVLSNASSIAFQYKISASDSPEDDRFGAEFMTLNDNGVIRIADYYDPTHSVRQAAASGRDGSGIKYAKSGLSNVQMDEYTSKLTALMESDKVYLESDLTMLRLASLVDCSVNHLSQAVNSGFGMSFFDFLNSYRIDDAKALLSQYEPKRAAILDVSFAVGFNSNSAFYAAFKKATGETPAQYRRSNLANNSEAKLKPKK